MQTNEIDLIADAAKSSSVKIDAMITDFKPFIMNCTKQYLKVPFVSESSDELSIAIIAFSEAIRSYDMSKGHFIAFAKEIIIRRLIDYIRKESIYRKNTEYMNDYGDDESGGDFVFDSTSIDEYKKSEEQRDLKDEIEELTRIMVQYDISFADVYSSCSKTTNTRKFSDQLMKQLFLDTEIKTEIIKKKFLPAAKIEKKYGIPRKKLDKLRNYIIMCILIDSGDFPMIRGFMRKE